MFYDWTTAKALTESRTVQTKISFVLQYCNFFFSSRRRHTRYIGDWSSDVCSSDLTSPATVTITVSSAAPATTVGFNNTSFSATEGVTSITITVIRTGPTTGASTVDYSISDGSAHQKGDFEYATGRLAFAAGDTQKSFVVLINDDSYVEGTETATLMLSNRTGAVLGTASASLLILDNETSQPTTNVIDNSH